MKNKTIYNTYIIKSIQLAIIQAFTAPIEITFELLTLRGYSILKRLLLQMFQKIIASKPLVLWA